jgi:hypothetical protein
MFRTLSREIYLRSLEELAIARIKPHADKIHRTSDSTGSPINPAPGEPHRHVSD